MSVHGSFILSDPDAADATLTISMTLGEWKQLRSQLTASYPSWRLANMIRDLSIQAEAKFTARLESEP